MAELASLPLSGDANLKGYWKLDSTTDSSGNSNTLTLVNSPSYVAGKYGNGLDLEVTSSQGAQAVDSASLSIVGNMTLSMWVNFESLPSGGATMAFVSKWNNTGNQRSFQWRLLDDGGVLKVDAVIDQTGAASILDEYRWNWTPSTGVWYHIALTITPGNASATTFELFLNGASQGNGTAVLSSNCTSIYDSTSLWGIGVSETGGASPFDGIVDDAAVFDRILTGAEILSLYAEAGVTEAGYSYFM